MARNEEKAQSMLNRWVDMKNEEKRKPKERRPYLASECRDLADAHKWRSEILREIGVKVTEIQNEGLGEHRLRDLNDEINKLLRERVHWERRIVELGGPNYTKHAAKMTDLEGNIIDVPNPSGRGPGYRYFGAAKKLPGVRELFEKPPEVKKRRTRYEIYKRIDASYYGYRDDEDGILEKLEAPAQDEMRRRAVEELERIKAIRSEAMKMVKSGEEERRLEMEEELERSKVQQEFVAHVPLPDDKEIERMVVEKKKKELLSKYMSEELMEEEQEAKEMLNVNSSFEAFPRNRLAKGTQNRRHSSRKRSTSALVASASTTGATGMADGTNRTRRDGPSSTAEFGTIDDIKAALYQALTGIDRGIFGATSSKKSEIAGFVELLESRNPTPYPTDHLRDKVDGCWKLVYSTISILGSTRTKLGLRGFISLGDFFQIINVAKEKATNVIKFNLRGLQLLSGQLTIEASYRIASKTRVDIKLERSNITPDQLMKIFEKNLDLLLAIFNPQGWLEITYVDESMRIGRDDKGNIFVLERNDDIEV
ncbi:unnamed protein product [Musa acuminata var. zebrina]